jgi:hypothetical protein
VTLWHWQPLHFRSKNVGTNVIDEFVAFHSYFDHLHLYGPIPQLTSWEEVDLLIFLGTVSSNSFCEVHWQD